MGFQIFRGQRSSAVPTLFGFGDAEYFLSQVTHRRLDGTSWMARTLIGAFAAPPGRATASMWRRMEERASDQIAAALHVTDAARLMIVIDAVGNGGEEGARVTSCVDKLAEGARLAAKNFRGNDAFVLGTTIHAAADRVIVAGRAKEYARRPVQLGEGLTFEADELRSRSIRQLLNEALL